MEQALILRIRDALETKTKRRVAVAIDGRCGAGKSRLAASLSALFGAPVVHMDDFFLPDELRTAQRLAEPGGNVHYERFLREVAPFLSTGEAFCYGKFDCAVRRITGEVRVAAGALVLVEGAYALHPLLIERYDLRAFVTVGEQEQARRIRERNGEEMLRRFLTEWIPMEERYIAANGLPLAGDLVIDTTQRRDR